AGGAQQQDDDHDDEDDGVGGFRPEDLGQPLDDAQTQAGDYGTHDGAHAADDHHREHHDDQVGTHERGDLHDGCGQHTGEAGQGHAKTVGQGDDQGNIDAESFDELGIFGAGA